MRTGRHLCARPAAASTDGKAGGLCGGDGRPPLRGPSRSRRRRSHGTSELRAGSSQKLLARRYFKAGPPPISIRTVNGGIGADHPASHPGVHGHGQRWPGQQEWAQLAPAVYGLFTKPVKFVRHGSMPRPSALSACTATVGASSLQGLAALGLTIARSPLCHLGCRSRGHWGQAPLTVLTGWVRASQG